MVMKKKIYKNLSASEQNQMQILYHFYVLMLKLEKYVDLCLCYVEVLSERPHNAGDIHTPDTATFDSPYGEKKTEHLGNTVIVSES